MFLTKIMRKIVDFIKNKILSSRRNQVIAALVLLLVLYFVWKQFSQNKATPQYQTAQVAKGTLVVSVSESGQVAVANRMSVTTQASGVVDQIYVKNGETVAAGQKIASIKLDSAGQIKQTQAWSAYLAAKSILDNANATLFSLQSTMYSKWNTYINLAQNSIYQNADGSPNASNRTLPQFTTAQDDWLAAEAAYKNQQNVILQAEAALSNNWLAYQAASSVIVAPQEGVINDLTIAPGMQIGSGSSVNAAGSTAFQFIANIKTPGNPIVTVNLSEADVVKVKTGQKVTLTFDALQGKTFTGKVLGINTAGVVTSGVTNYPATIMLDLASDLILPNMSANANIILNVKQDVLLVPSGAIQRDNGQTTVRVVKNGVLTNMPVEAGESSDSETEIISGVTEGQDVVVGILQTMSSAGASFSPFSRNIRVGGGNFGAGR